MIKHPNNDGTIDMTIKEYNFIHSDYKGVINGQKTVLQCGKKGATEIFFVNIIGATK